ncbi:MAG TPA: hypothetical protein VFW66_02825 [Gemmatimonadales bacterium]|nr:hypothetical protein [Gemmatimonadales bacterium]
MTAHDGRRAEESFDPESWADLRALGHRMVDDMLTWLETVREVRRIGAELSASLL